ncbi:Glycerophosphoryl diester phosphodiesterase [Pseudovibrio axinellae]|uniref:Glycerophosphoryl diester phosphodiesterase n=1 Tax=Pseudovibrio axinellae TaxID=989403 RepID=A0A165Z6Q4_9HYPH|nr:glycerophosphodiester phosphodiesterase [Pseudovibrio axinellae]KZL19559.1 Glycerophosphoryl diester phosphodiesterase [Pseudovibrio axinellae]SEQ31973.1 glycerophosphoryl diester phosphodiesterase [Pseudovibrio axinellae]
MAARLHTLAQLVIRGWSANALRMLLVHYAFVFLGAVAITPIVLGLGNFVIGLSGSAVLADYEIASFFFTPLGLLGAFVFTVVFVAMALLELVALLAVLDRPESTVPAARNALLSTLGMFPRLGIFTWRLTQRLLVAMVPGVAVIVLTVFAFLQDHDINYYLQYQPVEFWLAAFFGGIGLFLAIIMPLYAILVWGLSLPLVVLRDHPVGSAFSRARFLSRGLRPVFAGAISLWLLIDILVHALFLVALEQVGSYAISFVSQSAEMLAAILGSLVVLLFVGNTLISGVMLGSLALILKAALYLADGKGHRFSEVPDTPKLENKWTIALTPFRLGCVIALLGTIVVLAGTYWVSTDLPQKDVLVIAHRGASAHAPENTIASIEQAVKDKADWVEVDVQETADGAVIIAHDSDFMRLIGKPAHTWELTLAEMQAFDVGGWFSAEFERQRVPTLQEALEAVKGKATLLIELKYYAGSLVENLEEKVARIVTQAKMENEVAIMSLERSALKRMGKLEPSWNIGLLTATSIGDLSELNGNFVAVSSASASLSFIRRTQETGKLVFVWTVNNPSTILRYISMGVDGIITDDPALARKTLEEYKEMNQFERLLLHTSVLYNLSLN